MRTLKELFIILRDNEDKLETGLCLLSSRLWSTYDLISWEEAHRLKNYIEDHKPSNKSKFYDPVENIYYWAKGEWLPRLAWINYQIKILKNK